MRGDRRFLDFVRNTGFVPTATPTPRYENQGMRGRGDVTGGPALNRQFARSAPLPPPKPLPMGVGGGTFTDAQMLDQLLNSTFQNFDEPNEMNQQFLVARDPEIARQVALNKPLNPAEVIRAIPGAVKQFPDAVNSVYDAITNPQDIAAPVAVPILKTADEFYSYPLDKRKEITGDLLLAEAKGEYDPYDSASGTIDWRMLVGINPKMYGLPTGFTMPALTDAEKQQILRVAGEAEAQGKDPGRAAWEWYIGRFNTFQRGVTDILADPLNYPAALTPVGEALGATRLAGEAGALGRAVRVASGLLRAPEAIADAPIEIPRLGWRAARWGAGRKAREAEEGVSASIPILKTITESSGGQVRRDAEGRIADQIDLAGEGSVNYGAAADLELQNQQAAQVRQAEEQAAADLANAGTVRPETQQPTGPSPYTTPPPTAAAPEPAPAPVQPTGPSPYTVPNEVVRTDGGALVNTPDGPQLLPNAQMGRPLSPQGITPAGATRSASDIFDDAIDANAPLPERVQAAFDANTDILASPGRTEREIPVEQVPTNARIVATQRDLLPEEIQGYIDDPARASTADMPIAIKDGDTYYIVEGHHRTAAARESGLDSVSMRVINATPSAETVIPTTPETAAVTPNDSPVDPWDTTLPEPVLTDTIPARAFRGNDYALNPDTSRVGVYTGDKPERAVDRVAHDQPQVMAAIQGGTDPTGLKAWSDDNYLANRNLLRTETRADEAARTIPGAEPPQEPLINGQANPGYQDFRGMNKAVSNALDGEWFGRFRLAVHANGGDVRGFQWTSNPRLQRKIGDIDLAISSGLPIQRTFKDLTKESMMDYFIHGNDVDVDAVMRVYKEARIFSDNPAADAKRYFGGDMDAAQRAYDRFVYASRVRELVMATPEQLDALLAKAGMAPVPEVLNEGDLAKLPDMGALAARGSNATADVLFQVQALPVTDQNAIYRQVGDWAEDTYARIAVATPRERTMADLELAARLSEAAQQRGHAITVPEITVDVNTAPTDEVIRAAVLTRDDLAADGIITVLEGDEVIRRVPATANIAAEPALHAAETLRHDTYVDIRELRQRIFRPGSVDAENPMRTFANEVEHNARLDQEIADAGGRASEPPPRGRGRSGTTRTNGKRPITDEQYQRLLDRRTKQLLKEWAKDPTKGSPTKGDVIIGMMRADGRITEEEAVYLRTAIPIYGKKGSQPVKVTVFDLFMQELDKVEPGQIVEAKRATAGKIAQSVRRMPDADVPLVVKALSKPGKVYDTLTNFTREQLLYGLNAYKGGVVDGVTTAYTVYLSGHRKSALTALAPKTWLTFFKHNLKDTEVTHPILKMADQWGVKPGRNVIDVAARELQENAGNLLITRIVGEKASSPWRLGQAFRHAFDQSHRLTLWGDEFGRQLRIALDGQGDSILRNTRRVDGFYDRVVGVMGGGSEADDAVRQLKRLVETEGAFTPKQVREITGSGQLMDEWRQGLNAAKKAADDEVDRILFSYRQTKGDDLTRRVFMFHYWQSRAVVQHTKLAITNPLLMYRYSQLWEALDREAARQGENGPLAPFKVWFEFMKGDGGLYGMSNPIAVIVPMSMFAEAFDAKYPGEKRFEFLLRRSGMFLNPMLQGAAYALGQMSRPGDVGGTRSIRAVVQQVLDWDRNHHDIFGQGPGLTGDWFQEKQDWLWERVNALTREVEDSIPDAKIPNRGKTKQDVVIDLIYEQAAEDFGVPYDQMSAAQKEEIDDAIWAVRNGESGNARANEALATASPWWHAPIAVAAPGGVVIRSEAGEQRKDLTNQGYDTPQDERTPAQQSAIAQTSAMNQGSPEASTLDRERAQLAQVGTEQQQFLYSGWNQIAYGEELLPWAEETIGGKTYSGAEIMAMSSDERRALADLWVLDQNGTDQLASYRDERDQFIENTDEVKGQEGFKDSVRNFKDPNGILPDGVRGFREWAATADPNYARAEAKQRQLLTDKGFKGETLEDELDDWARSTAAYNAYRGVKDRLSDPDPTTINDPTALPPTIPQGDGGGSGGTSSASGKKEMPAWQVDLAIEVDEYGSAITDFEQANGSLGNFQSPLGQKFVTQWFKERGIEPSGDLKAYLKWKAERDANGEDSSLGEYFKQKDAAAAEKKAARDEKRKELQGP